MNIYAEEGSKIVYANPDNGREYEIKRTKELLEAGSVYTVDYTVVHQSSTEVYIKEVPDVSFNSVMFEDVEA